MTQNNLFRASSVMALGTIISRVTGFIRNIMAVAVLGTTLLADTYNVANTMPNILYNLLVGGALTAVFVPQLIRSFSDSDGGHAFASRLVTTVSCILLMVVFLGVLLAPLLVRLYAPGFATSGFEREFSVTVAFTRYCLPQIFFLGLFTMLGQVANSKGSFAPLMWAPIANNVVVIAVFSGFLVESHKLSMGDVTNSQVQLLGWGTTLGLVVQTLIIIPIVRRTGVKLRPKFGWEGLGKSFALAGWTLVYVFISQLGYLVTVNISTSAGVRSAQAGIETGVGFTPFGNAYLIMLLPYSIVTISVMTALLPHLSALAIAKKSEEVKNQLVKAIKMVGVITIPAGVALTCFGPMITRVLFFGISKSDSQYIGYVLSALGLGLVAFSINIILVRGFNAFEDTRTQVLSILFINVISVALSYLSLIFLKSQWVTVGIGFAFSISYLVGMSITFSLLSRHTGAIGWRDFSGQHVRLFFASLLPMVPLFTLTKYLSGITNSPSFVVRFFELSLVLVTGFSVYIFCGKKMGVEEISNAHHLISTQIHGIRDGIRNRRK